MNSWEEYESLHSYGNCSEDLELNLYKSIRLTEELIKCTETDPFSQYPPETISPILEPLKSTISTFRSEVESLVLFCRLVHWWSDADDKVPELGDVVQKLSLQLDLFCSATDMHPGPPSSFSWLFFSYLEIRAVRAWASEWIDRLSVFVKSIESVKPLIENMFVRQNLATSSLFRLPGTTFSKEWDRFSVLLISRLTAMDYCQSYSGLSDIIISFTRKWKVFSSFHWKLISFTTWRERRLLREYIKLIGDSGVAVGLLYCENWCRRKEMDEEKAKEFENALLKIQVMNPDYFDAVVRATRDCLDVEHQLNEVDDSFEDWLKASCIVVGENNPNLISELKVLIRFLIFIPLLKAQMFNTFSSDVRGVIWSVVTMQNEIRLQEHYSNILLEIWFLKMDIWLNLLLDKPTRNSGLLKYFEEVTCIRLPLEEENQDKILKLQQEVLCVLRPICMGTKAREISKHAIHKSLLKILLFKAELSVAKFLYGEESLMAVVDITSQLKSLLQGIDFLSRYIRYLPDGELPGIQPMFMAIDAAMRQVISLRCSVLAPQINEKSKLLIPDLLQEITKLKEMFLHDPMRKSPKTNGLSFIDSLLRKLSECLKSHKFSVAHPPIQGIVCNLRDLRLLLSAIPEGNLQVQKLKEQVLDAAYEIEDLIDLLELGPYTKWLNVLRLSQRMEDMDGLIIQLRNINETKEGYEYKINNITHTSSRVTSPYHQSKVGNITVGTDLQEQEITDRLTRPSSRLEIVSITGMPGIGKTTLALKVYNSRKVSCHFYVRAWCYVSQQYKKGYDNKRLLLEILNDIVGQSKELSAMSDDELAADLRKKLLERRYLIVMDDLWSVDAWDDLRQSFPDDGNGSKILITSRESNLNLEANRISYQHIVHPMSADDSWNLLKMKISDRQPFREELAVIGRKIAGKCHGMPLAIVSIAGLLESAVENQDLWVEMEKSLSSVVVDNAQTGCMKILELSYKYLPDYLKPCFLYFGAFPGDQDISVSKMTQLWLAEGFIQETGATSLEDIAQGYLIDLISRNLIMVSKSRSDGGVKSCRVHDLLREMCLAKAREENFLELVTRNEESDLSYAGLDYGVYLDGDYPLESVTYNDYRLCILAKRKYFAISKPSGARVRSLLFFDISDMNPGYLYDLSFICDKFKLLKVLNLERINTDGASIKRFKSLIHLRYLAVSGTIDSVHSSIEFLKHLKCFTVKGSLGVVILPPSIWNLVRLRHLRVSQHGLFTFEENNSGHLPKLESLVSLSSPLISSTEDLEKITMKLPNLRKLRCVFSRSQRPLSGNNEFRKMDFPAQLESLAITYYGSVLNPFGLNFPLHLRKLALSNFRLQWDQISFIGRLPNLEVLKLLSRAFEGETWEMTDEEFPKLKFLKLESLNIKEWVASSDSLPNLQKLVLRRCKLLNEVPISFGEIPTLEIIEVHGCGEPCVKSVVDIREENYELKVVISHAG